MSKANTTTVLTRESVPFLVEAMEQKKPLSVKLLSLAQTGVAAEIPSDKSISGAMNIPEPVNVNAQGTMSEEDYKACSMVMAVCQNMVQKTITDAAKKKGVPVSKALQNMEAWVTGYTAFPFPFFNFKDAQAQTYKKNDFSLSVNPDAVDAIVNIENVANLKNAVIGALKASQGKLIDYSKTNKDFNYFGVITAYTETEIQIRLVKFQMHMQKTDVKTLCGGTAKTTLDSTYNTYMFAGDKELMIKMQEKMAGQMVDYFSEKLMQFLKSFYDQQLADFNSKIADLLSSD